MKTRKHFASAKKINLIASNCPNSTLHPSAVCARSRFPPSRYTSTLLISNLFSHHSTLHQKPKAKCFCYVISTLRENDEVEIYLKKLSSSAGFGGNGREERQEKKIYLGNGTSIDVFANKRFGRDGIRSGNKWKGK